MSDIDELLERAQRASRRLHGITIRGEGWSGDARKGFIFNPGAAIGGESGQGSGGGGPPAATGACCVGGDCSVTTLADCEALGGNWFEGVPCSPNPCCMSMSFTATVSGCSPPITSHADPSCTEPVCVDGSASGSTTFTCVDSCDCIFIDPDTSSCTATWDCTVDCPDGCVATFLIEIDLQFDGTDWIATVFGQVGINCGVTGLCTSDAPFTSLDSPQTYNWGPDPTGVHTLDWGGDVTGFSYHAVVTVTAAP